MEIGGEDQPQSAVINAVSIDQVAVYVAGLVSKKGLKSYNIVVDPA
jgi:hypothetical protein